MVDASELEQDVDRLLAPLGLANSSLPERQALLQRTSLIFNKIDLLEQQPGALINLHYQGTPILGINLSAKHLLGLDSLISHLQSCAGFDALGEGIFTARTRHLIALQNAENFILSAVNQGGGYSQLELVAEDLRLAQQALGVITGEFTSDDLLGEIFSAFCVGK